MKLEITTPNRLGLHLAGYISTSSLIGLFTSFSNILAIFE
jgi:hypothetical protein